MSEVLVVGSGVAGLTTAITLLEAGMSVHIWAQEEPGVTPVTTNSASAMYWPVRSDNEPQLVHWAAVDLQRLTRLAGVRNTGIKLTTNLELLHDDYPPWWAESEPFASHFRDAESSELPAPEYMAGHVFMDCPVCTPQIYWQWLYETAVANGARVVLRSIAKWEETADFTVVVNCTGGEPSSELRPNVHIRRRLPWVHLQQPSQPFSWSIYDGDGTAGIVIGHNDYVFASGPFRRDDPNEKLMPEDVPAIMGRVGQIVPELAEQNILRAGVCFKPNSPDPIVGATLMVGGRMMVKNYGSGSAFTVSWGAAQAVKQEVLSFLH